MGDPQDTLPLAATDAVPTEDDFEVDDLSFDVDELGTLTANRTVTIVVDSIGRPPSMNDTLGSKTWWHIKKKWRVRAAAAGSALPQMMLRPPVHVTARVLTKDTHRGRQQDIGNAAPCAKAMLDGLIDAGLIDDDTPDIIQRITFVLSRPHTSHGMELILTEAE